MTDKAAIFLDIENLSGWLKTGGGETLLEHANTLGQVVIRRAYGDFSLPSVNARQTALAILGFEFVHVSHPVRGKNSADIQIVVDAMEYLTRVPDVNWFILATGDSDFSPPFRRLRELGKSVIGVGPRSTLSEAVHKSCSQFIYVNQPLDESTHTIDKTSIASTVTTDTFRISALSALQQSLQLLSEPITLSVLKKKMHELDPSFDLQHLGYKKFLTFLQSAPEVVKLQNVQNIWLAEAAHLKKNTQPTNSSKKTDDKKKSTKKGTQSKSVAEPEQLRQSALSLLEKILKHASEPISVSVLKQEMLKLDSSFKEKKLGHKTFLTFLKSAPQVIQLQKRQKEWVAKAA